MLLSEASAGKLKTLIARSADFIGPSNSVPIELAYRNLARGKSAQWFADVDKVHSLTFTPDSAKATAILGNTPEAYGRVWHMPTDSSRITGRQWIELFAKELGVKPKFSVISPWMLATMGLFVPIMKEFREMTYQYDRDYFFDSSDFTKTFGFTPTDPATAVKSIAQNRAERTTR